MIMLIGLPKVLIVVVPILLFSDKFLISKKITTPTQKLIYLDAAKNNGNKSFYDVSNNK